MISVDWKWLVQFGLLGSSDLEQYAILLVRVSLGLFFAISGANKLFLGGSTQAMYETLVKATVPFPRLMTYFVSGVEFVGGSLVAVGVSFEPCMRGSIGRYACRHPDHHAFSDA
jgi:putative oxidoreductase